MEDKGREVTGRARVARTLEVIVKTVALTQGGRGAMGTF